LDLVVKLGAGVELANRTDTSAISGAAFLKITNVPLSQTAGIVFSLEYRANSANDIQPAFELKKGRGAV
jgi:hypothetical protein